jgi:hypothetical protein
MGGSGSSRWEYHMKKRQVEECTKLSIFFLKPYLKPGYCSTLSWSRGGCLQYQVIGNDYPTGLRLFYAVGTKSGHPEDLNYSVILTTTPLPWGGVRYWFECPIQGCGRRVGCLYMPHGGKYFGCRHCYRLVYGSQQEGASSRDLFRSLAAQMQDNHPGIDWMDVRALLDDKETLHLTNLAIEQVLREEQDYVSYEGYLSAEKLCQQSGLDSDSLSKLEAARLLLPDTKDGRYRPKLAGWGKKLAYLLREGWGIEEIKVWSRERWKTEDPKKWPPRKSTS